MKFLDDIYEITLKICGIPNIKPNIQTISTRISCFLMFLSIQSPNPSFKDVMMTSTVENCKKEIKDVSKYLFTL